MDKIGEGMQATIGLYETIKESDDLPSQVAIKSYTLPKGHIAPSITEI